MLRAALPSLNVSIGQNTPKQCVRSTKKARRNVMKTFTPVTPGQNKNQKNKSRMEPG